MAKYIALVGFAGVEISAYQGQEIELPDNDTTEELVSIEDEQSKSTRGKKK